jgi:hypothetical protein
MGMAVFDAATQFLTKLGGERVARYALSTFSELMKFYDK